MLERTLRPCKILVVDDEPANVLLLQRVLQTAGLFDVIPLTDPRNVIDHVTADRPDLIMLDLQMPHLTGFDILEQLETVVAKGDVLPIVVLTADVTPESRRKALGFGATDFLTKPFDAQEVILRTMNLLHIRCLHLDVREHSNTLEEKVRERTRELREAQIDVVERLAVAVEFRDDNTGDHVKHVGSLSGSIGRAMGLPEDQVQLLRLVAPLHDIGKIAIPDAILFKQGPLTHEDKELMRTHCKTGSVILSGGSTAYLRAAEEIARTHHERWDGRGYPCGLSGEEIPLFGRIVAVADVFDALTRARPYKAAWPASDAITEIIDNSGTQFDPRVVEALVTVLTASGTVSKLPLAA